MTTMVELTRIMCVDQSQLVREALERKFTAAEGFAWCGALDDAGDLAQRAAACGANIVFLEFSYPGPDPFLAITALGAALPSVRVIVLSSTVSPALLDRAFDAGAWGYFSKADRGRDIVEGAQRVAAGEVAFGAEVLAVCGPMFGAAPPRGLLTTPPTRTAPAGATRASWAPSRKRWWRSRALDPS